MTTFSFYSFRIFKIFPYINLKKILLQDFGAPSGRRPGAAAPPCPPLATPLVQLYKLYYKLRNNLLLSHFHTFTPYYHNDHHTHDLRYTILRLPMTDANTLLNVLNINFSS